MSWIGASARATSKILTSISILAECGCCGAKWLDGYLQPLTVLQSTNAETCARSMAKFPMSTDFGIRDSSGRRQAVPGYFHFIHKSCVLQESATSAPCSSGGMSRRSPYQPYELAT